MWVGPVVWVSMDGAMDDPEIQVFSWKFVTVFAVEIDFGEASSHAGSRGKEFEHLLDYCSRIGQLVDTCRVFLKYLGCRTSTPP